MGHSALPLESFFLTAASAPRGGGNPPRPPTLPQRVGLDLASEQQQCQAESEFLEIQLPSASQAVLFLEGEAVPNYSSYRGGKINFLLP